MSFVYTFVLSFIVAFALCPFVIKFSTAKKILKHPHRQRDVHTDPVPLLGGVAIILSFIITILANVLFNENFHLSKEITGLVAGIVIIAIMGILDDLYDMKPVYKAVLQVIGASVTIIIADSRIEYFTAFANSSKLVNLPYVISFMATVMWIFLLTNAFNIIDGIDGLTAGTSIICAITLFIVNIVRPDAQSIEQYIPILLIALAGAASGFLPFNFNPAKLYLGETGAAFLGFTIAVISIQGTMKAHAAIAVFIPVIATGLPILDISLAYFRRIITKKPIAQGDREHIHHRLLSMGLSQRKTVLILYGINILLGFTAYLLSAEQYSRLWLYFAIVAIIIGGLVYLLYKPLAKRFFTNGNGKNIEKEQQDEEET